MTNYIDFIEFRITPLGKSPGETEKELANMEKWLKSRKQAFAGDVQLDIKLVPSAAVEQGALSVTSELLIGVASNLLVEIIKSLKRYFDARGSETVLEFKIEQRKGKRQVLLQYDPKQLANEKMVLAEIIKQLES